MLVICNEMIGTEEKYLNRLFVMKKGEVQRKILEIVKSHHFKWVSVHIIIHNIYHPEESGYRYTKSESIVVYRAIKALDAKDLLVSRYRTIKASDAVRPVGYKRGGLLRWKEVSWNDQHSS